MKQTALCTLLFMLIVFALPFLTLAPGGVSETPEPSASPPLSPAPSPSPAVKPSPSISPSPSPENYADDAQTVRVSVAGEIRDMPLSDYLFGVLAAEMPETFPAEALKAQAVAARTLTAWFGYEPADDTETCQAYTPLETVPESVRRAVRETDGAVMLYGGEPIMSVYFSTSWGVTESALAVWGGDLPYLQSVESAGEEDAPRREGRVSVPGLTVTNITRDGAGGVTSAEVNGETLSGAEIRRRYNLNSVNFTATPEPDGVTFVTAGFGHGAGMPQYGAKARAEEGAGFEEILGYYYKGVTITHK